jgi:hypothetical protein
MPWRALSTFAFVMGAFAVPAATGMGARGTMSSVLIPEAAFPNPLTWTGSVTHGADLMGAPIAFEKSFQMAYSRTHYGAGYYIYHQYVPGIPLTQPIRRFPSRPGARSSMPPTAS